VAVDQVVLEAMASDALAAQWGLAEKLLTVVAMLWRELEGRHLDLAVPAQVEHALTELCGPHLRQRVQGPVQHVVLAELKEEANILRRPCVCLQQDAQDSLPMSRLSGLRRPQEEASRGEHRKAVARPAEKGRILAPTRGHVQRVQGRMESAEEADLREATAVSQP